MKREFSFGVKYGENVIDIPGYGIFKFNIKYGLNTIRFPIGNHRYNVVQFIPKYGENVITIDVYGNLTDLHNETFTIINQIPQSASNSAKSAWKIKKLYACDRKDGIYDKSSGTMLYRANTWTAYIFDWENYRPPTWLNGGFYAEEQKSGYWTAAINDLLIFADVDEQEPKSTAEFQTLVNKYRDLGGLVTGTEEYINYKPSGEPWKINHIELIKG